MKAYRNAALIIVSLIMVLFVSYGQVPSELFAPGAVILIDAILFIGFLVIQAVREDMRDRDEIRRHNRDNLVSTIEHAVSGR